MSWEVRDGRRYYYRNKKVGGRIRREYFGPGPVALLASAQDLQQRQEREDRKWAVRTERNRFRTAESPVLELHEQADLLVRATLLAAGYHRHNCGIWRRRNHDSHAED